MSRDEFDQPRVNGENPGRSVADAGRAHEEKTPDNSACQTELLRVLVHDIRNCVAPIRNAAHLLKMGDAGKVDLRVVAELLERQTASIGRLLDSLVDTAATVGGNAAARATTIEAGDTVQDIGTAARETGTRRRILLADDNAALRETMSDLLQEMGHEVTVAANGLEALELACRWRPDFVFLDINMPHLNGYEVARQIREQFPPAVMRLVMMSGDSLSETAIRGASQAGFDFCIDKIGDLDALNKLLNDEK